MTVRVDWESPRKPVWHERLLPLKQQPGRWAKVRDTSSNAQAHKYASRLRHHPEEYNLPPGRWEFKGEKRGDGGALLARYLGDEA